MNNKFKRILSAVLVSCMLLTIVPLNASSNSNDSSLSVKSNDIKKSELDITASSNEQLHSEQEETDETNLNTESSDNFDLHENKEISSDFLDSDTINIPDESAGENELNDIDNNNSQDSLSENDANDGDNWELGLVFYDSSVNNGRTALNEINWDASDNSYLDGSSRIIKTQINYKNTNTVTSYDPGEISIKIPNLVYNTGENKDGKANWKTIISVGANDSTHSKYDWDFKTGSYPTSSQQVFEFQNAFQIEEGSNFEGSIQIVYTITPSNEAPEIGNDECIHEMEKTLVAYIDGIADSNEINFSYTRTYVHPWKKFEYKLEEEASKISSYDSLPENADDYIWVKYTYKDNHPSGVTNYYYPWIYTKKGQRNLKTTFPDECIVFDKNFNQIYPDNNKIYTFEHTSGVSNESGIVYSCYVGYPKSEYNTEKGNLEISNTTELWGPYYTEDETEKLSEASVQLNLDEFRFIYSGDLYRITKSNKYNDTLSDIYIKGNGDSIRFALLPTAKYTGTPMTLKIGDDLVYASNEDGQFEKLEDSEYWFTKITWNPSRFINSSGQTISSSKYDCELWVRYQGDESYTKYATFKNPQEIKSWTTSKKTVGFYFIINDMKEGLSPTYDTWWDTYQFIDFELNFKKQDIPNEGELNNICYLQVFFKDSDGNLILQNEPEPESYDTLITKEEILTYDIETYGTYMQRHSSKKEWSHGEFSSLNMEIGARKINTGNIIQNAGDEYFTGKYRIGATISGTKKIDSNFLGEYNTDDMLKGFKVYDLLPEGMDVSSNISAMKSSKGVECRSCADANIYQFYLGKLTKTSYSYGSAQADFLSRNISSVDINITKNWNETGRTMVEAVFTFGRPVYVNAEHFIYFDIEYKIPYDSYMQYGSVWHNTCYTDKHDDNGDCITVNGEADILDIDGDGQTDDILAKASAQTTISSIVSTQQDITKYVKTDRSGIFTTKEASASPGSEYQYKLRVRTGKNDVTNLVIYDSIEEYAKNKYGDMVTSYGNNEHWNGEFIGIDTSYAEEQGFTVKTYYSSNDIPDNLGNSSWKEYDDNVDKSLVKSIAFEFLDKEGNPAIIPESSITYVVIKMKAPDEEYNTFAYNGFYTQWNAIDTNGNTVDFITGINSNITKVTTSTTFSITVNKIWNDQNDKWQTRPDSIEIYLYKDGKKVDTKKLNKDETTVVFENLPIENSELYTIRESDNINYNSRIEYDRKKNEWNITNTPKKDSFRNISGKKIWVGDNGLESERPDSITITLLRNGEPYRTTIATEDGGWEYNFNQLPMYNKLQQKEKYSVQENIVENYITEYIDDKDTNNLWYGNALKVRYRVTNKAGMYAISAVFYYKKDGFTYEFRDNLYYSGEYTNNGIGEVIIPSKEFALSSYVLYNNTDNYGYQIEILSVEPTVSYNTRGYKTKNADYFDKLKDNGNVCEDDKLPYIKSIYNRNSYVYESKNIYINSNFAFTEPHEEYFNIINTYNKKDIAIQKQWLGDNGREYNRPDTLQINLLRNVETINNKEIMETKQVSAENEWKCIFKDMLIYNEDKILYEYSAEEPTKMEKYDVKYDYIQDTYKYNGLAITFDEKYQKTQNIMSSGLEQYVEIYYREGDSLYKLGRWTPSEIAGETIYVPTKDFYCYYHLYKKSNSYRLQSWGIKINSIIPTEVTGVNGEKMDWNIVKKYISDYSEIGNTNYPESEHVSETGYYSKSINNAWHYTYGFDTPGKDLFYISNIYNGIDISGKKTWSGDKGSEKERPDSVTINLIRNGEIYRQTVTDSSKNWEYEFLDLPKKTIDGEEYSYSIEENNSSEKYIPIYHTSGNGLCITFGNELSNIHSQLTIYSKKNGCVYYIGQFSPKILAGEKIYIPSKEFFINGLSSDDEKHMKYTVTGANVDENLYVDKEFIEPQWSNNNRLFHYVDNSLNPKANRYDIENQYKDEITNISGKKIWVGDEIAENKRPDYVTINLYQNEKLFRTTITNKSKNWEYEFKEIPIYDKNLEKYNYRVVEEPVDGYLTTYNTIYNGLELTLTYSMHNATDTNKVTIYYNKDGKTYSMGPYLYDEFKKIHIPSKDFYLVFSYKPSSNVKWQKNLTVKEYDFDEIVGTESSLPNVTFTEIKGKKATINPYYSTRYHFSYEEDMLQPSETGRYNIKNIYNLKNITGKKYWKENVNKENISITLLQNGKPYKSTETNESQNWEYSFIDVPILDENAKKYSYSVKEENIGNYYPMYTNGEDIESIENSVINNGLAITFNEQFETEGLQYDYIDIYYKKDGKSYSLGKYGGNSLAGQTILVPTQDFYILWHTDDLECNYYGFSIDSIKPATVNNVNSSLFSNTYESKFEINEVSGNTYPESEHENYGNKLDVLWHYVGTKSSDTPQEDLFNIININNYKDISGIKVWDDKTEGINHNEITINLLQNNNIYMQTKTDSSKNWEYTFKNVPIKDENNVDYIYTIKEDPVPGYVAIYDGYNITNKYNLTEISGNKTWIGDKEENRPEYITINLYQDENLYRTTIITAANNWEYTFRNIDILKEDGTEYKYTIKEKFCDNYIPEYNGFNIKNIWDGQTITGTKHWVDESDKKRPDEITINLFRDDELYKTTTSNEESGWKYSFENVPIHREDGTQYEYYVIEEDVPEYRTEYVRGTNGLNITFNNSFKTESVNYDYIEIYYKLDGKTYKLGKWGGTSLAGQTISVPSKDFWLYWRTDSSSCSYYGFSIDSIEDANVEPETKATGNIPSYTATEITDKNYPDSAFGSHTHGNYGNNVNKLWHYTKPQEVIANKYDITNIFVGPSVVNIKFTKTIDGTSKDFDKMLLDINKDYNFDIELMNTENMKIVHGIMNTKGELLINGIFPGTYTIKELDDTWFQLFKIELEDNKNNITLMEENGTYILTIGDHVQNGETINVKITNKIKSNRFFDSKYDMENIFIIK